MSNTTTDLSQLEQLKKFTTIVADTGDFQAIQAYKPQDATTNPTLILKATQMAQYRDLVDRVIKDNKSSSSGNRVRGVLHRLLIEFGREILKIIPGRVSTETDADLSFDTAGLLQNAKLFISLYEKAGVPRDRILIKIASSWEGIRAAEQLEKEGIHCNMTLMFSLVQAAACAEADATLISPFVGRILDWHKKNSGKQYSAAEDPGVESVRAIYGYYKKFGYRTEVMGASFRSLGEILELAGCDLLTISPNLLDELQRGRGVVERKLDKGLAAASSLERVDVSEPSFRWLLNQDAMATEKTAEGIRSFAADAAKLEKFIAEQLK